MEWSVCRRIKVLGKNIVYFLFEYKKLRNHTDYHLKQFKNLWKFRSKNTYLCIYVRIDGWWMYNYVNMEGCIDAWMHVCMYLCTVLSGFFFVFKGIDIKGGRGVILYHSDIILQWVPTKHFSIEGNKFCVVATLHNFIGNN